jgi:hypothetical protein
LWEYRKTSRILSWIVFIASIASLNYRQQRFKNRPQKADFELRKALLQKGANLVVKN